MVAAIRLHSKTNPTDERKGGNTRSAKHVCCPGSLYHTEPGNPLTTILGVPDTKMF